MQEQLSLFKYTNTDLNKRKSHLTKKIILTSHDIHRLHNYNLDFYIQDIKKKGLKYTWDKICQFVIKNIDNIPDFIQIKNFGELYEIGLAIQNKNTKKKNGQYYTPEDVALIMSQWLVKCKGENICDVACGTGKLILTYLDLIGYEKSRKLIASGKLYLYDFDEIALKICKTAISIKYGLDIANKIHNIHGDFLNPDIKLPSNCKVISNPPYAKIEKFEFYWTLTDILLDTKEFYSAFMDKIFSQANSAVIITPFSFLSSSKYYSLREKICNLGKGFIVAFDNVPGNIFCGRKHGIFNTNTANSVRAAITVFSHNKKSKGFKVSPLIRFKNEERKELLRCDVLESLLNEKSQIVDKESTMFKKIFKHLEDVYDLWISKSKYKLIDFISKNQTNYIIDIPNTCRYYTTGSSKKLFRSGSITLYIKNKYYFDFIYCFINSSFTYWWWRIFDGGITYPLSLLMDLPIPFNLLSEDDKLFFKTTTKEMCEKESEYTIKKVNAGHIQANIKFPEKYRKIINERILKILNSKKNVSCFDVVHSNKFIKK